MKFVIVAASLLSLLISGCATTANYETVLNSWKGQNINDLINVWGYPINSYKIPNGNMVYVYSSYESYTTPTNTTSTYSLHGNTIYGRSNTYGGQTMNFWCNTFFEAKESGQIVTWRWEGNNCKTR